MKTSLRLLDEIRITSPCLLSWESMTGNDRVRHCWECNQQVFDLSSLTAEEGIKLMQDSGGKVCVRLFRRTDGRVVTRNCATVRALQHI